MNRQPETPVFHLFRCPHCEGTHFEHERSASSFARWVAKHLTGCGKPQEPRPFDPDHALTRIVTREVGSLVIPDDWMPACVKRARVAV